MKTLILIRGLPGSGKSTLARTMRDACAGVAHWEADMYFVNEEGKYIFEASKLWIAHDWCINAVWESLNSYATDTVIVSNTFTQRWEMKPYFEMAKKSSAQVVVLECKNHYGSIHGIPEVAMQRMRARWEELSDDFMDGNRQSWKNVREEGHARAFRQGYGEGYEEGYEKGRIINN